jgi:hypothetical protein
MSATLNQIPRVQKREIAAAVLAKLKARAAKGPAEPALDGYIEELTVTEADLSTAVTAGTLADAKRTAQLARLEAADVDVDTWYRHVESYLDIESRRKVGQYVLAAGALHDAAFPDGLAHIDDSIVDENRICRETLAILRSPDHAQTVKALKLPAAWLTGWEEALLESEAAYQDVELARTDKRTHIGAGRDAEQEWVELFVRLRRYVASRAKRSDHARIQEGKTLLAPLLDVLAKLNAQAAARATRRKNVAESSEK